IKKLFDELNFVWDNSGVETQVVDRRNLAATGFLLKKDEFESSYCNYDLKLGLSLPSLEKSFKFFDDKDSTALKADCKAKTLMLTFTLICK
ncbi:hypothetical protein K502DRAFT_285915, partial [Neoconidiobolus thromboides FSU 785]